MHGFLPVQASMRKARDTESWRQTPSFVRCPDVLANEELWDADFDVRLAAFEDFAAESRILRKPVL